MEVNNTDMSRIIKFTYDDVKDFIENNSECKLLSTEYKDAKCKLKLKCKCGDIFMKSFKDFKYANRRQCVKCGRKNGANKLKHTYDFIKNYIEIESGSGCKLISKEYISGRDNLELMCKCGNIFHKPYDRFKNNKEQQCKVCGGKIKGKKLRNTDESIKNYVSNLGYELVDEYINSTTKFTLKDINGYYYKTKLVYLRVGKMPSFVGNNNPYTIDNIKLWCKLNNKYFELISDTYKNASTILEWKCLKEECLGTFKANWNTIYNGAGCSCCCGRQVTLSNCLATVNPNLASQWHFIKNGKLTPYDVTPGSNKIVWWTCKKCKNVWKAQISNRNNGRDCPQCNESKGEQKIRSYLNKNKILFKSQYIFNDLISDKEKPLIFYFAIFNKKQQLIYIIEYDGQQHFRWIKWMTKDKYIKSLKYDIIKNLYLAKNNIPLIRIPYWEFDNIEKYLNIYFNEYK